MKKGKKVQGKTRGSCDRTDLLGLAGHFKKVALGSESALDHVQLLSQVATQGTALFQKALEAAIQNLLQG